MSTASSTEGNSSVVATGPVWPPPSPPCTITASAPHDATLRACLAAPTDGITTAPASFSRAISSCRGANANEATFTPSRIIRSTRSSASVASARMLTPNGRSVAAFTLRTASANSSSVIVADARMPRPPAFAVADTSRAPATHPIPVCTTGCSMPTSSVSGVLILVTASYPYFLVPQALRVDHLLDQLQLVTVRQPRSFGIVQSVHDRTRSPAGRRRGDTRDAATPPASCDRARRSRTRRDW